MRIKTKRFLGNKCLWFVYILVSVILLTWIYYLITKSSYTYKSTVIPPPESTPKSLYTTYINKKFGYSFQYSTNFSIYPSDSYAEKSALIQLSESSLKKRPIIFEVIIISKIPKQDEYDGSRYDPFTYDINKVVNTSIGQNSQTTNGSSYRYPRPFAITQ